MSKTFSVAEVASHNKANNLYIIVDEDVYDVTTFQDEHPGMFPHLCGVETRILTWPQVERRVSSWPVLKSAPVVFV